jgi:hypothetical protein
MALTKSVTLHATHADIASLVRLLAYRDRDKDASTRSTAVSTGDEDTTGTP